MVHEKGRVVSIFYKIMFLFMKKKLEPPNREEEANQHHPKGDRGQAPPH